MIIVLLLTLSADIFATKSGYQIAHDLYYRKQGRDYCATMEMEIKPNGVVAKKRIMEVKMKKVGEVDKTLIRVLKPSMLRGTSFLTWNHAKKDNEQWIYLASLKRVRRIATRGQDQGFIGSDYSYQDLSKLSLEKYHYKRLIDQEISGSSTYVLEVTPKNKKEKISKRTVWIDKSKNLVLKVDLYNKHNKLIKTLRVPKTEMIEGVWTITASRMDHYRDDSVTTLKLTKMNYNCGVKNSQVSKNGMK